MSIIITTVLSLIQAILAGTGVTSTLITSIINTLEQIVPLVVSEVPVLAADVKNIIASLQGNSQTPAQLMATLANLDAQADSALDAAAKADGLNATTTTAAT